MKSKKEILDKIKQLEEKKIQLAETARFGKRDNIETIMHVLRCLDTQITLLKWVNS